LDITEDGQLYMFGHDGRLSIGYARNSWLLLICKIWISKKASLCTMMMGQSISHTVGNKYIEKQSCVLDHAR
jgi:hypothetical protein